MVISPFPQGVLRKSMMIGSPFMMAGMIISCIPCSLATIYHGPNKGGQPSDLPKMYGFVPQPSNDGVIRIHLNKTETHLED